MDELKLIFASNLIRLRTAAGMTQAELGEQLNYSDKSISKWERGEAIPDAAVLKRMGEIFGVTIDYLLNEHDAWQPGPEPGARDRSHYAIILVALMGSVTLAVLVFVVLGGLVNSKTRRMTQAKKDALNKLCAETELPPEVRGMVIDAVNWQVRRMATTSLKENSKYKSNMKKDLRTFIEGYFGRFNY